MDYISPNIDQCDNSKSDYQFTSFFSRYEKRVTICEGPTTIECLLDADDGIAKVGKRKKVRQTR